MGSVDGESGYRGSGGIGRPMHGTGRRLHWPHLPASAGLALGYSGIWIQCGRWEQGQALRPTDSLIASQVHEYTHYCGHIQRVTVI